MTLIELLYFVAMIAIGIFFGKAMYPIGGFWLATPGFIAGVLLIPFLTFAYDRYRRWAYLGDKPMPDCSCGSTEYVYENIEGKYPLVCQQCRAIYEKRRDQVFVFENGAKIPYKRLVKHQGWV